MKEKDSTYRMNPKLAWREVDGKVAIVAPGTQELVILNPTGSILWTLLAEGPRSRPELASELVRRFEIAAEEADRDADAFLEELLGKGLIDGL